PGRFGIGDLGPGSLRMLDILVAARQRLWQVLPLGPTGYGDSPYAARSAFAGNPLLISPERLLEEDLLSTADLASTPPFDPSHVDYRAVDPWKTALLRLSFAHFTERANERLREEFSACCAAERDWLQGFGLFSALQK